ncbi:zinc ribbon domain-containing protein [Mailhella massiliensis]|uniref:C4-type zinc ribbon domain-containing protein n=1 Tax=Mailhella massiliensis TaxID=1903261 RepID=A0A921DT53_9BACT|nr:C4-type zinc ribbon domain-containing protein [Mailhella massiliensis]HJD97712.1 C4-type zinc ribbon domain-containing protein [Mailhella massiliensis]
MSLYIEQIRQLVALQHVDDGIHAVHAELEAAPKEVENLQKRFQSQDAQRNWILDKLQHIQEQQKRLDADIQDDESRLMNSKNKLMQVENDREYQAMIREMDTMERQNQTREEERMALQEERSLQEGNLRNVEETWNALKAELESQRENLEKRLAECRTKLEELEAQRAEVSTLISPPVLSRYEFIRNRLRHPVIVSVEAGVCSGCHIAIPPQVFIDLQRGNHIMSCPNCQRLMYWAHDYQDPDAPKAEPQAEENAE